MLQGNRGFSTQISKLKYSVQNTEINKLLKSEQNWSISKHRIINLAIIVNSNAKLFEDSDLRGKTANRGYNKTVPFF